MIFGEIITIFGKSIVGRGTVLVPFLWDTPRSDGSRFDDHLTNLKVLLFQLHLTEKIIVKLFREQKE